MCFPKPPKPDKSAEAYSRYQSVEAAKQTAAAETDAATIRAQNKDQRTEQALAVLNGRIGRRSLFSRNDGGAGFARGRSMFSGGGAVIRGNTVTSPVGTPPPAIGDGGAPTVGRRRGGVAPSDRGFGAPRSLFGGD